MYNHTHNPEDKHVVLTGAAGKKELFCIRCADFLKLIPKKHYDEILRLK